MKKWVNGIWKQNSAILDVRMEGMTMAKQAMKKSAAKNSNPDKSKDTQPVPNKKTEK